MKLFLLSATLLSVASADSAVTVVSAFAPDASGLTESFELFRYLLGGEDNLSNTSTTGFPDGHRQINWDADAVPFDMPGDFFAATVPRGLKVSSDSDEFRVSNADGDDLFNSINWKAAQDFSTFSAQRLFSPIKENVFVIEFSVPGQPNVTATVDGFGAVFVAPKSPATTTMTFINTDGQVVFEEFVLSSPQGLSFLGAFSPDDPIAKVVIQLGSQPLDDISGGCILGYTCNDRGLSHDYNFKVDHVVVDDFLFSEPQAFATPRGGD